jgi:hypothetical protein
MLMLSSSSATDSNDAPIHHLHNADVLLCHRLEHHTMVTATPCCPPSNLWPLGYVDKLVARWNHFESRRLGHRWREDVLGHNQATAVGRSFVMVWAPPLAFDCRPRRVDQVPRTPQCSWDDGRPVGAQCCPRRLACSSIVLEAVVRG